MKMFHNNPAYQLSVNYEDWNDLNSPYTDSSLSAVPNWRSSLVVGVGGQRGVP